MASISLKYKSKSGNLTAPGDVDPGAMIPLMTTTLSTNTSSITFSDIPQNYTHLQIRGITGTGDGNNRSMLIYPNNDQSAIYSAHSLFGDGATTYAKNNVDTQWNVLFADGLYGIVGAATYWTSFIIDILDYKDTNKYKTTRAIMGWDANGSGIVGFGSANWRSTTAITSLTIMNTYASSMRSGSTFALYGIKTAGA